jgi:DNA-binding transcriptional LysR family regulator
VSSRLSPRSSRRGTKAANARGGVSGRLKVGAPVLFASYYVAPIVSRFLMLYPNVEVELKASDEQVDLDIRIEHQTAMLQTAYADLA